MTHHPRPSLLFEPISEPCAKPTSGNKHRNLGIPANIGGGLLALLVAAATLPAAGQMATASNGKFVGNVLSTTDTVFDTYWNQATPENAGKWESVEATRDVMNWTQLDYMYAYTRARGIPFKQHTFVWGQQYPAWITTLSQTEQREEVEEWIAAFAARYPDTEFIDVVNEPLPGHAPPPYAAALGGAGATGWDWVIWSFEKARQYLPNAKLLINDYSIINSDSATTQYLTIINLLKDRGLIDGIGEQAHGFESTSITTLQNNLNRLAATGLPVYISELEINIADDTAQSNRYQQLFPVFWTNPAVRGITFWGYKQGQIWRENGYLLRTDGSERPAMEWLETYIAANPQSFSASITSPTNGQGLSNLSPVTASATVTYGTAPFTVTFQKKLDSETEFTTVSSDSTAPYTADLGILQVGTYQIRVSVTDGDSATVTSTANTFNVFPAAGGTWLGTSGNWNDSAIWAGGTIANGADSTASFTGVDIAADQTITLNGNRTIGNIVFTDATTPSHNLSISGADTLTLDVNSGAPVINVTQTDRRLTISSVVAGNDGLQKSGLGMLTLSGGNTYTGTTTVSDGTLRLEGNAFSTIARAYSITSGAVMDIASGSIPTGTGTGATTISGGGTLLISGAINGGADGRDLNLSLGAGSTIDIAPGGSIFNGGYQAITWTNNKATLNVNGSLSLHDGFAVIADALTGAGTIQSNDNSTYGSPGLTLGVNNGSGTFSGNITAGLDSRAVNLTKNGTGTQIFSGSTTWKGTTTVNGGALQYAKTSSLYAGVTTDWVKTKITVNTGGTIAFNVGGTDEFTAADVTTLLTGLGGTVNNNGLRAGSTIAFDTTNASGGTFTLADAIANTSGTGGGAVGLRKLGANTLVLTHNNTYTGSTIVDDGTLTVTGSLGTTAVSVNSGTLTGNGNFGGNVTIAVGATHSLAVAATTAGQDTSAITGTLAMAQSTLNLTAAFTPADGVYVLATATVGITGFPSFINYNGIAGTVSVDTASTPKRLLLTVNGSPPSFSASVTAPANGQVVSNVSPVTASATVTNGTAPFTVTFQKKLDSESEFTTVNSDDTAPYTADLGILPAGTYQIRVSVTDGDSATVTSTVNTFNVIPTAGGTWLGTSGNWNDSAIWTGGTIADGADSTAFFTGVDISADQTITLNGNRTIGNITFTDATTSSHNLTITGNTLTLDRTSGVPSIDVTQAARQLTISSIIAGNDGLLKNGAGTLRLTAANTFTGDLTINAGSVFVNAATGVNALSSGKVTIGDVANTGASADLFYSGTTGNNSFNNLIDVRGNGTATISVFGYNPTFSGAINLGNNLKVISNNNFGSTMGFSGGITGTGNLVIQSNAANGAASSAITFSGTTLNFTGSITNSGTTTSTTASHTTISAVIGTSVNGITQNSTNSQLILTGNNTFTGNILISSGTLQANRTSASSNPTSGALGNTQALGRTATISSGGTMRFVTADVMGDGGSTPNLTLIANGGTIQNGNSMINSLGPVQLNGGTLNSGTSGNGFKLTGTVTVGGSAVSTISSNGSSIGSGSVITYDVADAVVGSGSDLNVTAVLTDIFGTGGIIKSGAGTMTLSNVNTYTGATRIDNGTLALAGASGSIATSASVTIKPGAALDTSAKASYTIPTGKPVNFGIDSTGSGSSGKITAAALNVSNATVTYNITGPLNDAVYVLATYNPGFLTGTFLSAPADPVGYTLNYAYEGNKIALVQTVTNTAPSISDITNQSVPSGGNTGALAFTITDEDVNSVTPSGSSSNPTLVPNGNIAFGGSGANRTVTVTPVSGLSGSATITVTMTDNGDLTAQDTFTLTVTNNYLSWAAANGVTGGVNGDDDNDGVKNLVEYALVNSGERGVLNGNTITFTKRGTPYGSDLTYIIETSETLAADSWTDAVTHGPAQLDSPISHTFTPGTPVKNFARLKITSP